MRERIQLLLLLLLIGSSPLRAQTDATPADSLLIEELPVRSLDSVPAPAPDSVFVELLHIPGAFRFFETDRLAQLYLVTDRDELIKYSADGREQFRYHNTTLGQISFSGCSGPFFAGFVLSRSTNDHSARSYAG